MRTFLYNRTNFLAFERKVAYNKAIKGDDCMDFYGIAAASMSLSQAKVQQGVQLSVMKKTMDSQEAQAASLLDMLPPPNNYKIDVYA